MKKILLCVAIISISLFGYTSYADEDFSPTDTLVADIVNTMPNLSLNEQLAKLEKYEDMVSEIEINPDSREALISYIRQKEIDIVRQLDEQSKAKSTTTTKLAIATTWIQDTWTQIIQNEYQVLENTDRDNIVNYRLWLHNTKRAEKWLAPVTYDKNLEMSAYTRSNVIRDEKRTVNFHKRKKSDNNYSNYGSMKDWFANLGIIFDWEGTEFSENIWRGLYSYRNKNLTEELKKQILKTFTRFINEERINWAHYRAIMMPQYTKIGLGIALDPSTKKYFLVTHYSK